ncbi:MAG: hypothetical protein C4560_07255 [Nitrospiraceae bacterium]|nr:MAG: hypothetical protein C4560_07255 [Nitrospiraceae bacterium]
MNNNKNKALITFELSNSLRGIAIFIIFICHYYQWITPDRTYLRYLCFHFNMIAVCLFLVLSGYGLNERFTRDGLKNFLSKRLKKIFLPYWLIILLLVLFNKINISDIFSYVFLIEYPPHFPGWFLQFIVFTYAYFFITCSLLKTPNHRLLMFLLVSFTLMIFTRDEIWRTQSFSVFAGLMISSHKEKIAAYLGKSNSFHLTLFFLSISILIFGFQQVPLIGDNLPLKYVGMIDIGLTCFASIAIMLFFVKVVSSKALMVPGLLGFISYELYLTHSCIFGFLGGMSLLQQTLLYIVLSLLSAFLLKKTTQLLLNLIEKRT